MDAIKNEGLRNGFQKPNRTTRRTGCLSFVYICKDVKLTREPWTVWSSCFEHNHPSSENKRAYNSNRKLNAEDQEFAIALKCGVTSSSKTLKTMFRNEIERAFEKSVVKKAVIIINVILTVIFFSRLNMSSIRNLKWHWFLDN